MHVMVWIHAGPLAGKWRPLSREDGERAEREGWGQIMPKRGLKIPAKPGEPHPAAEAYRGGGLTYQHREMRAAGSPPARVPLRETAELPPTMIPPDGAPEPDKPKRGRPRKPAK